jgi:hypothetical protein
MVFIQIGSKFSFPVNQDLSGPQHNINNLHFSKAPSLPSPIYQPQLGHTILNVRLAPPKKNLKMYSYFLLM